MANEYEYEYENEDGHIKCRGCAFFVLTGIENGKCHRYPEGQDIEYDAIDEWWCVEGRAKKNEEKN